MIWKHELNASLVLPNVAAFSVFLLPFIPNGLQDHVVPDLPATTRSLCNVPGMPGSDMHGVA
jgi:hypothetical protein